MAKKKTGESIVIEEGSGNVFADLGLPEAETRLAKAMLVQVIRDEIERRGVTQAEAAELMGLKQPDVSNLTRGRLSNFSMDRLETCLNRLNFDIRIQIAAGPRWKSHPGVTVEMVPAA